MKVFEESKKVKVGFRPMIFENLILRYELKGKARTRPDIFRVVLGPCAHCCLFEAPEQK